jgi:hypothetical protein
MLEVIFLSSLVTVYFYLAGSIFEKKIISNFFFFCKTSLNGLIFLSFLALVLNFFLPLNKNLNTIVFLLIVIFSLWRHTNNLLSKHLFCEIFIISILIFLLIFLSNSNRPDSGLYHYPYVNILNEEKIIFGLSNLHSRFGHVSIIQYTSAILNNYFFTNNGIVFPIASIAVIVFVYLISEIFNWAKKNKKINFYILFIILSTIFISYKMNRYSEYGNDYSAHFLMIYLCSIILKLKKLITFNTIYKYSIFIFLNKIIIINVFLLCALIFVKKITKQINFKTFLLTFLLILWFVKNLIITGCLIYPIKNTCVKELSWTNVSSNSEYSVENISILIKSWSKGWPDQKGEKLDYYNFNKNFNWVETWANNHLKKIIFTQSIFISISFFIFLFFYFSFNNKFIKSNTKINIDSYEYTIFFTSLAGIILWFWFAPVYRFAISNILIVNIFILIFLFKNFLIIKTRSFSKKIKIVATICILIFVAKNLTKMKDYNIKYNNYPWPKFYSFNDENYEINLTPIFQKNEIIYYVSKDLCMYSKPLCTTEIYNKKITLDKKNTYKFYLIN